MSRKLEDSMIEEVQSILKSSGIADFYYSQEVAHLLTRLPENQVVNLARSALNLRRIYHEIQAHVSEQRVQAAEVSLAAVQVMVSDEKIEDSMLDGVAHV